MIEKLTTTAEKQAQKAEKLAAFDKVNLVGIKRGVEELLALIGRNGIFDEYTKHDISHIDAALKSLDWLIPSDTAKLMTPADWLLTVLAIYFHDIGMLVTNDEFAHRHESGFTQYCDNELFGGDRGADYKEKVEQLEPGDATRFLYQEYVRSHHAVRVRDWVTRQAPTIKGVTKKTMRVIDELLAPLGTPFRQDLGLICESHHLDDLTDFKKYKTTWPYGNSPAESANVHYAALLLRTADLLHITQDRTPSIVYKTINPTDPISQDEWAKQMGVRSVRSKMGLDAEGQPNVDALRDTIEVHAHFTDEKGFFGLTSYLSYVKEQLAKSHEAASIARKTQGSRYDFPWRDVDSDGVKAEGFIPETFEFTIDQEKVLDLLTGHTLYNDTSVVIRELAQNAIDAARLQTAIDEDDESDAAEPTVRIVWNRAERTLVVTDTGTGMSQATIEKHFLKVGASRYQDDEFRKSFPNFSPISRFGIGILSAFMVADEVEVITSSEDEDKARQISLRSLHGKYLVKLLDKESAEVSALVPHGTSVTLKIRRGAKVTDVLEAARQWIVIPRCQVTVETDGAEPVLVGFQSPSSALLAELQKEGIRVDADDSSGSKRVRVTEEELDGVTLAYALQWSPYFREWEFLRISERDTHDERDGAKRLLGTCLEGIRVESTTPGYLNKPIWAIANSEGPASPRTNVARSGIEATEERANMLRAVYRMFCRHVSGEMEELRSERGYSTTWAAGEARYLIQPLIMQRGALVDEHLFSAATSELRFLLLEAGGNRQLASPQDIESLSDFWTVHCPAFRSAETLIRELPGSGSLAAVLNSLESDQVRLPGEPILCGLTSRAGIYKHAFSGREIGEIKADPTQRRADLNWEIIAETPRWVHIDIGKTAREMEYRYRDVGYEAYVATQAVPASGLDNYVAMQILGDFYFIHGTPLTEYLIGIIQSASHREERLGSVLMYVILILSGQIEVPHTEDDFRESFSAHFERHGLRILPSLASGELFSAINSSSMRLFDPFAWSRED